MVTKARLIKYLVKELQAENLAIFAGAGLSKPAGFVDWKSLLTEVAEDLDLDIDKEESNLVALAQYHVNSKRNRTKINQLIIEEFSKNIGITENHRILSRLPIHTFWTTNYDDLIEKALEDAKKVVDIKHDPKQLLTSPKKRDAVVYKMHGDYRHPTDAVIIKDDYERYLLQRNEFYIALRGDLLTKKFLFLGFSFADPNIDYILGKIRAAHTENHQTHYCILRRVQQFVGEDLADFEYREKKQKYFIEDLQRVGVETLLVKEYSEITEILKEVESAFKKRTVFISGAAHDFQPYTKDEVEKFIFELSKEIIKLDFRVISGFGLGIGSSVIAGAIDELLSSGKRITEDDLILRPFPQTTSGEKTLPELWTAYRKDMISFAGISLFLFGNKIDGTTGKIIDSTGMIEEFEIAKANDCILLPVGATGSMAKKLAERVAKENLQPDISLENITNEIDDLSVLKQNILGILKSLK
ncbi:SIR2 family protein [Acinetobacter baumannii]|uniref:SIR2 family protein n=1 Tax=Acinetobacter baumannii TaxID=470 RepID=UPI0013D7651C|nr:SIR2 family protein [Acinetobacter baumannii]